MCCPADDMQTFLVEHAHLSLTRTRVQACGGNSCNVGAACAQMVTAHLMHLNEGQEVK